MVKMAQQEETDVLAASDVEGNDNDGHDDEDEEDDGGPIDDVASNSLSWLPEYVHISIL